MGSEIVVFDGDEPGPEERSALPPIITAARQAAAGRTIPAFAPGLKVGEFLPKYNLRGFGSMWETTIAAVREAEQFISTPNSILSATSRVGDLIAQVNLVAERYAFKTPQLFSPAAHVSDLMKTVDLVAAIVPPNFGVLGNSLLGLGDRHFNFNGLQPLLESWRAIDWASFAQPLRTPTNWPDDLSGKLDALLAMVNDEGIPVAWVPRTDVLNALLAASPGDVRSEVLIAHRNEVLEDCEDSLTDMDDPFLDAVLPIAREVLDACRDGHWRVAAIAAVPVVHAVVEGLNWVSDRQRVAKYHRLEMKTPYGRLLEQATRAPLVLFYDDWNPKSGQPRPAHLTRHVVSHHLGADQVTERNCIVAVMLMASLLATVYQLGLGQREIAA